MQPKIVPSISFDIDTFTKNVESSYIVENDMTEIGQSFLEQKNIDQGESCYIKNGNHLNH